MVRKVTTNELKEMMRKGNVTFQYLKKDGSIRTALGTTQKTVIESNYTNKGVGNNNENFINYWDLDKKHFRRFHKDMLLGVVE